MRPNALPLDEQWNDLSQALAFAENRFGEWEKSGAVQGYQLGAIRTAYAARRSECDTGRSAGVDLPGNTGLPMARPGESEAAKSLRYWTFLETDLHRMTDQGLLPLARGHALWTETREHRSYLESRLAPSDLPEVLPVDEPAPASTAPTSPETEKPRVPRRNLLEILLDPRNIQMLLAFGGALMVVGLVILLWINEFFTPPLVALGLGVINAGLLGVGCWVVRSTRYQIAGRALTLIACLIMPLNLWYYHANHLITLDGHLWVAALVISVLYAVAAWVLKEEVFVYIFTAGITLTGMLFLADLPPSPQKFWEIAAPAVMLVVLGLLAIHAERAFPEQEGPFSRRRFGLAFFWSGHALLAAGLLLVLGAQIAGDWLYQPFFQGLYRPLKAVPSPIVSELRWLALVLVVAGAYAYIYSDLVVRHVGIYVHIASAMLLWALVLSLQILNISLGVDGLIVVLAVTALAVNGAQASVLRDNRYTRAFPVLGVLLPLLAVALGLLVYFRALNHDFKSVWQVDPPSWSYVAAMLLTALSCRAGAHLYREKKPELSAVYFFATAAAVLVAATACLAAMGLNTWQQHAPWLMLVPIAYLIAARLYRGKPEERPLLWVSHVATLVMLASSLASVVEGFASLQDGFGVVQRDPLNLVLALFCAEATVFYALATVFQRQVWTIHLAAAMACGAVWQLLTYAGVAAEFYTLTFALVGLALLVVYRFALVERFAAGPLADAAFQSANTLLSLSFVAALFLGLSRLATKEIYWGLVGLFAGLTVLSLVALVLVRHSAWRRWYVVTAIAQAGLTFLGMTVLSELSAWQKLEIFSVVVGLLLLALGHLGWYREQERHNDLVSVSLLLGSLLVGVPLAIATLVDRSHDHFIILNEAGFLAAAVLLVTTGFLFQLKSTTLVGSALTAVYFITLLVYVPWSRLNAVAIVITAGGGTIFGLGLILSVYRDRLLTLPDRVKRREGLFRVLNWR
jgi:hypothetical protein